MPGNRGTSNQIDRWANRQTDIKIGAGLINFLRPGVHPIFIEKNRRLRWFLDARFPGKKLQLLGIARLGNFQVGIKPAVVSVTAVEHGFSIGCPSYPGAVGITLFISVHWRIVDWSGRTKPDRKSTRLN